MVVKKREVSVSNVYIEDCLADITNLSKQHHPHTKVFESKVRGRLEELRNHIASLRYWKVDPDKGTVKLIKCENCGCKTK